MSKPYDASPKELIDWLLLVGRHTTASIDVIDADVSTVTAAADKVIRVQEAPPWLLHLELQSSPKCDPPSNCTGKMFCWDTGTVKGSARSWCCCVQQRIHRR